MIEIVPFHPHHAKQVLPKIGLRKTFLSPDQLTFMHKYGMALSARQPGNDLGYDYLGFGGFLPLWDGVVELYTFLTDEMKLKYPLLLHRTSKKFIKDIQIKYSLHRAQFNVQIGNPEAYRWAKQLGFTDEGTMPLFTKEKDTFIRFGKIWQ